MRNLRALEGDVIADLRTAPDASMKIGALHKPSDTTTAAADSLTEPHGER
jgi:hypothetical protein